MEAYLKGSTLFMRSCGNVYWFNMDGGESRIGLNGVIPFHVSRITVDDFNANRFMDDVDVLAFQFPEKDEADSGYTSKRRTIIEFAERELGPYMETVI
ncbi:MAG: hypothetical protein WC613_02640 [Candidatus Aenigmatarchaeota archaeon]